jgi:hypothetical protein
MKKRYILIPVMFLLLILIVALCLNPFVILKHKGSVKEWADIVQYKGEVYECVDQATVNSSEIGTYIGRVKYTLANENINYSFEFKNYYATYLQKRTKLYLVEGDANSIAAKVNDGYFKYTKPEKENPLLRTDRFGRAKIEWIDTIQYNDKKYINEEQRKPIDTSLIGKEIGEVKFNVSQSVSNGSYKFRNFDATCLPVGTKLYSMKDNPKAIAAFVDGAYYSFFEQ